MACSDNFSQYFLFDCWSDSCSEGATQLHHISAAVQPEPKVDLLKMTLEPQDEGSGLAPALRRPRRSRRSVFLHSGVRICPQESVEEVLSNHQAYYQLRGTYHNPAAIGQNS